MQLQIDSWRGWTPGISSTEQWQQWAATGIINSSDDGVDVSVIPAMLRRRLSPMGRAATSCLLPLLQTLTEPAKTPIIFASRHGEVGRTQKMLCDLASEELLSPTAFSLSVHNAICGIISINQKITANINAIAASGSELMASLVEAAGLLQEKDCQQVLCILCDEPLPESYKPYCQEPSEPFALALILSNPSDSSSSSAHQQITLQSDCRGPHSQGTAAQNSPLEIIRLLVGQDNHINASFGAQSWTISRTC